MYFKILFTTYLKNFLIIFFSLVAFFIFMDFMINKSKLPNSTNLQVLYVFYNGSNAGLLIYPLALLLGALVTIMGLVKKNEMIAFLSVGYSVKRLLFPIATFALLVTSFFIFIQVLMNSSFSDKANGILNGKYFSNINSNLFFKFNDNIIFINKLNLLNKTAYGMKIFVLKNGLLYKNYEISEAQFKNNIWKSDDIIKYQIINNKVISTKVKIDLLKGFKPDILNKLESRENMSLKIAIQALYLLKKENINLNFIKTYIYNAIVPPLSFILLIFIVFLNSPLHSRISNTSLFIAISLFSGVILWGVFLLVRKMSISGILNPDFAFISPLIILFITSLYYFRKI